VLFMVVLFWVALWSKGAAVSGAATTSQANQGETLRKAA
jgi:hypothetical protein